jgi:hypothetical protein
LKRLSICSSILVGSTLSSSQKDFCSAYCYSIGRGVKTKRTELLALIYKGWRMSGAALIPIIFPVYILRWNSGTAMESRREQRILRAWVRRRARVWLQRQVSSGITIPATFTELPLFLAGDALHPLSYCNQPSPHNPLDLLDKFLCLWIWAMAFFREISCQLCYPLYLRTMISLQEPRSRERYLYIHT